MSPPSDAGFMGMDRDSLPPLPEIPREIHTMDLVEIQVEYRTLTSQIKTMNQRRHDLFERYMELMRQNGRAVE